MTDSRAWSNKRGKLRWVKVVLMQLFNILNDRWPRFKGDGRGLSGYSARPQETEQ